MDWSSNSKNKKGDQSQIAESVHKEYQSGFGLSRSPWTEKKNWQVRRWASPSISQMTHWRLRWCQSSVHPWHPLLWQYELEVLHLFRCSTHTPRQAGLKTEVPTVRWRWGWQGDESEMRMKMGWKLLNRNTRRGTPKRRGGTKREHQHQHTLPGAGEPWKGKGKEKAEADGRTQRQAEGGRTDAPEPT